jgi:ATP-dependent Clp protease protease subunit
MIGFGGCESEIKTLSLRCRCCAKFFGVKFESRHIASVCKTKRKKMIKRDFEKFAHDKANVGSLAIHNYANLQSAYVSPTIIEERQLNIAQMDVFSRLMMDRIIFLGAPINDDVANIIQAQLLFLETTDPTRDISIYINSPGGSVSAGLGIYDTMQMISPEVATICTGMAASMGAVLLTAGAAGKRSALPHSRIMIHQPLGGVQGQASDIEITAREIMRTKQELYEILSQHSGVPIEKIAADADRDYWLRADEAVEYGLIDEVIKKSVRNGK